MTEVKFGPRLKWTDEQENWTKVEWYRLTQYKEKEIWIEKHCKGQVWTKTGSHTWNSAYYFEDPREAVFFKMVWT